MNSKLGKGMALVLLANIINLCFNFLTNLILPKHLSVASYAALESYHLYMAYIGVIHLGFNDGMYLKYGGQDLSLIEVDRLWKSISTLRVYLTAVMVLGVSITLVLKEYILTAVFLAMLPTNLLSYYQFLYQACGEFKRYSRIINCVSVGTFFVNALLIYVAAVDSYMAYLLGYILLNGGILLFTEAFFHQKIGGKIRLFYFSLKELVEGIRSGILLMLGNFSSVLMTSMDRLFVKALIGEVGFAQYSFAVRMENFLNTVTTPITVTMYNHFCIHDKPEENTKMRQRVMVFASVVIAAAFPVKFLLETYLQDYYDCVTVLFLLFASQMFYVLVKGVYVNLYHARKQQKRYFSDLIWVITFGFVANVLGYLLFQTKEAFAVATLLSAMFWLGKSQFYFRDMNWQDAGYLLAQLGVFLITGSLLPSVVGFLVYVIWTLIGVFLFVRPVWDWAMGVIKKR